MITYKNKSYCNFKTFTDDFCPTGSCDTKFYSKIRSRLARLGTLMDNALEEDFEFVLNHENYTACTSTPIYVKGIRYANITVACESHKTDNVDIHLFTTTIQKRLERLEDHTPALINLCFTTPLKRIVRNIIVEGVDYRSFAKACEAYGLKRQATLKQFNKEKEYIDFNIDTFFITRKSAA